MKIDKYKRSLEVSYSMGAEATVELLRRKPECVKTVYFHPDFRDGEGKKLIGRLCFENSIYVETAEKPFNILSQKENCFVIGVFEKFTSELSRGDHIVLVNPSNAGNAGTIIRTAVGFGIPDIAVITPAVDFFDPKTVRASIGAIFSLRFEEFSSFDEYLGKYPGRTCYPFMLNATDSLTDIKFEHPASLVFGNEATGLPPTFDSFEHRVIIKHTRNIDSLNLPIAAGIAIYKLTSE